jgi:hypothetical protein
MNIEEIVEDAFEIDDDVVELHSLETDSISVGGKKKGKKRRKTLAIWQFYDIVPNVNPEDPEIWAKCKARGNKYKDQSLFGTGNLRKHVQACPMANTRDVGQMLLAGKSGSLLVSDSKFDPKRYRELLVISLLSIICIFHMLNMKV